jgi:hypothetical protein
LSNVCAPMAVVDITHGNIWKVVDDSQFIDNTVRASSCAIQIVWDFPRPIVDANVESKDLRETDLVPDCKGSKCFEVWDLELNDDVDR